MSRATTGFEPSAVMLEPEAEKYLGLPKGALAPLGGQVGGPQCYLHKAGGHRQYERAWLDEWQTRRGNKSPAVPPAVVPSPAPAIAAATVRASVVAPTPSVTHAPIAYMAPPAPRLDPDDPSKPLEARIRACWEASPDLRDEFGTFAIYEAYRLAEAAGRISINRGSAAARPAAIAEPSAASIEERCAAAWRVSPELRAEFGDKFEHYLAYSRAEASGQVRVYKLR